MGLFAKQPEVKKHYDIMEELGSGNFATVHKAKTKAAREWKKPDGSTAPVPEMVAVKVIDKGKVEDMNDITREIEIMQMVSHPNIIQLFEIFDEQKKMNLVLEVRAEKKNGVRLLRPPLPGIRAALAVAGCPGRWPRAAAVCSTA